MTELISCVRMAISAPSIHNSQPWRFRIRDAGVDVFADWSRQLELIDPHGRELLISIGAAIFNLRLAMRRGGQMPVRLLWPEPSDPDMVARVKLGPESEAAAEPDPVLEALAAAMPLRHTNRRPFAPTIIAPAVMADLSAAAEAEDATLDVVEAEGRGAIFRLVRAAEQHLRTRGIYRAETVEWTHPAQGHHANRPPNAFGPWDAMEALPLRDFGFTRPQPRETAESFEPYPAIVILCTDGDTQMHWLRAGEALQRLLLTATVAGLAATPVSQPLEIPSLRELVNGTIAGRWAQVILRLGYAQPTALTPRRPLSEVLIA
jgi:nitroreductase